MGARGVHTDGTSLIGRRENGSERCVCVHTAGWRGQRGKIRFGGRKKGGEKKGEIKAVGL